jgi:DNA-binding response OmpR family regulator
MTQARLLIVDDDANVREVIAFTLKHSDCIVETAANGVEALIKIRQELYDLLILDLEMEPVSGLEVLESARKLDPDVVVIILTGHSSVDSAVKALRLGAFDYIFKPSSPGSIRERVREGINHRQQALQRRQLLGKINILHQVLNDMEVQHVEPAPLDPERRFIRSGKLVIDSFHRSTTLNGDLLDLTTSEFDLLTCLVSASPSPISPRQIVNAVLGYDLEDHEASEIVKWHIHRLRQKIEPDIHHPRFIKNVRYRGYLWSG